MKKNAYLTVANGLIATIELKALKAIAFDSKTFLLPSHLNLAARRAARQWIAIDYFRSRLFSQQVLPLDVMRQVAQYAEWPYPYGSKPSLEVDSAKESSRERLIRQLFS